MAEYIEREAAIRALLKDAPEQVGYSRENAADCIRYMDAADVAPVRHGRWVKRGCKWQCTHCKVLMSIDGTPKENLLNYCPNCGALMNLEEEQHELRRDL